MFWLTYRRVWQPVGRFYVSEEVLHQVPLSVRLTSIWKRIIAVAPRWYAGGCISLVQPDPQRITVIALVSYDHLRGEISQHRRGMRNVSVIARTEEECSWDAFAINDCMQLGVPSTFKEAQSLLLTASGGIQPAAMHLDMRSIQVDRTRLVSGGDFVPELLTQAFLAPAPIVPIDRIPVRIWLIDRSPRTALAQDKQDRREHLFDWQGRPVSLTVRRVVGIITLWWL